MDSKVNKYSSQLIIINSIFIILWLSISIFPFLWTLWGSFKVKADFFSRSDWSYAISGFNTLIETGANFTLNGYIESWTEGAFWKAARNTVIVTFCVVTISLFLGTLGAYALSRSTYKYTFWILIAALIFRAMPHITLVSGYLFPFFELQIWGILPTTIIVLVAINQPFTLWLLYSFFKNSTISSIIVVGLTFIGLKIKKVNHHSIHQTHRLPLPLQRLVCLLARCLGSASIHQRRANLQTRHRNRLWRTQSNW